MADVLRLLPPQSLHFSCSLLSSSTSKSQHLSLSSTSQNKFTLLKHKQLSPTFAFTPKKKFVSLKVHATVAETEQPKWWEKNTPNMLDIHSTQEFLDVLSQAGDRLVIVEFYGTWCASCRALFPKLCRTAEEHPEIQFVKVNFDENKQMCKSLNVKVLPYFHFYHGADGLVESFSCSLVKFQKIKDAIKTHNGAPSHTGPPKGVGDLKLDPSLAPMDKSSDSTSSVNS